MLFPLIGARTHGMLDHAVVLAYLMGAYIVGLRGTAMAIAIVGAFVHFAITFVTNYPQGTLRLLRFRTHGFLELAEGIGVLAATWRFLPEGAPTGHRVFLTLMGISQLTAFSLSDYRDPS